MPILSAQRPDAFQFLVNTWCFKSRKVDLLACVFREKPLRLFQSCNFCTVPLLWCVGKHDKNWRFWCLWFSIFACWRYNTIYLLVLYLSHKNIYASPVIMCRRLLCSAKYSLLLCWIKNRSNFRNAEGGGSHFCHQCYRKPEVPSRVGILSCLSYLSW